MEQSIVYGADSRSRGSSYIAPIDSITEMNDESVSIQTSTANTSVSYDKNSKEICRSVHNLDNDNNVTNSVNIAGNNVTNNSKVNSIDNAYSMYSVP